MLWSPLSEIKDNEISEAVELKLKLQDLRIEKLLRVRSVWKSENITEDLLDGMQNNDDESDGKDCNSLEIAKEVWSETHEEVAQDI